MTPLMLLASFGLDPQEVATKSLTINYRAVSNGGDNAAGTIAVTSIVVNGTTFRLNANRHFNVRAFKRALAGILP